MSTGERPQPHQDSRRVAREVASQSPRVLVVDHHDSYTWNLVHLLAAVAGAVPDVVEHDDVTADAVLAGGWTHLVLSPGPGTPDDERDFSVGRRLLREAQVPVLGVCLGMQGLVSVYGGRIGRVLPAHGDVAAVRHDGTGVFAGLPSPFEAVRYHSLAALEVPDVLVETAWCDGPDGPVVMGVAHRQRPQWGVQFHPESVLTEHGATLVANFLALS
jgi:anthranilate synthase component 2